MKPHASIDGTDEDQTEQYSVQLGPKFIPYACFI